MNQRRTRTMRSRAYVLTRKLVSRKRKIKAVCYEVARTVFWGSLILLATVLVNRLINYIGQSSYLAVNDVRFEGCQRVSPQELMALVDLEENANILTIRLREICKTVKRNPWIKDVAVKRELPQGLTIKVAEREPAALVADGGLFLVDKDGVVFKEVGKNDPVDLPVITGLSLQEGENSLLNEGLAFLRTARLTGDLGGEMISEVHVDGTHGITLYTLQKAIMITMGFADYREKLALLAEIQKDLHQRNIAPGVIHFISADTAHIARASSS